MNGADGEATADAKVILDLVNALASGSFDPSTIDRDALARFVSRPTLNVPRQWLPMMGEINEHVAASLRRFPQFSEIDFSIVPINKS